MNVDAESEEWELKWLCSWQGSGMKRLFTLMDVGLSRQHIWRSVQN
jgi:hypothetical protein